MQDAAYAKECQRLAKTMSEANHKALMEIAEAWTKLAEEAEEASSKEGYLRCPSGRRQRVRQSRSGPPLRAPREDPSGHCRSGASRQRLGLLMRHSDLAGPQRSSPSNAAGFAAWIKAKCRAAVPGISCLSYKTSFYDFHDATSSWVDQHRTIIDDGVAITGGFVLRG